MNLIVHCLALPRGIVWLDIHLHDGQVGHQNISVYGIYDSYEVLHSKVELDTGSQMLGPGEHRFAFSFIIDSTAAPYERCA